MQTPSWHRQARELFRLGQTNDQIAKQFGVTEREVNRATMWVRFEEPREKRSREVDLHTRLVEPDLATAFADLRSWGGTDD